MLLIKIHLIYSCSTLRFIILLFSSLKELAGQEASILSYIDPLVAVLISVLILGETMSIAQAIGGVLILGFTLWNELTPHN